MKKNLSILAQAGVASTPVRVKRSPNSGRRKILRRAEESQSRLLMPSCKHDLTIR